MNTCARYVWPGVCQAPKLKLTMVQGSRKFWLMLACVAPTISVVLSLSSVKGWAGDIKSIDCDHRLDECRTLPVCASERWVRGVWRSA